MIYRSMQCSRDGWQVTILATYESWLFMYLSGSLIHDLWCYSSHCEHWIITPLSSGSLYLQNTGINFVSVLLALALRWEDLWGKVVIFPATIMAGGGHTSVADHTGWLLGDGLHIGMQRMLAQAAHNHCLHSTIVCWHRWLWWLCLAFYCWLLL